MFKYRILIRGLHSPYTFNYYHSSFTSSTLDGVLSPRAIRIRPAKPVIQEGNSLLLTCAVIGPPRSLYSNDAPYLNFELPEMPYSLENEVQITYISRKLTLCVLTVKIYT